MKYSLATISIAALIGYLTFHSLFGNQTTRWHQRMTIVVDTSTGDVSGSSVTEVANRKTDGVFALMETRGVHSYVTGEAVVVEVQSGRYMFALLEPVSLDGSWKRDAAHWVYPAFGLGQETDPMERTFENAMRQLRRQLYDQPVPLPPDGWPLMVTFDDLSDPATVRKVDPLDLAATFGPGVKLRAVTLELTNAPITSGKVVSALGEGFFSKWAALVRGSFANGKYPLSDPFYRSLVARLTRNDFIVENNQ